MLGDVLSWFCLFSNCVGPMPNMHVLMWNPLMWHSLDIYPQFWYISICLDVKFDDIHMLWKCLIILALACNCAREIIILSRWLYWIFHAFFLLINLCVELFFFSSILVIVSIWWFYPLEIYLKSTKLYLFMRRESKLLPFIWNPM